MSLINILCEELTVTTRKPNATLRMSFRRGRLCCNQLLDVKSQQTGNTVSATINPEIQKTGVDTETLQQWLIEVLAASPTLRLFFNDVELSVIPQIDA